MLPTKNEEEINNKEIDKTRITKIGAMMRNHGLDELPQIYNVLLGNMSFIGPRPLLKKNIEKIVELNPDISDQVEYWMKKRVSVKPGISGWEQVNTLGPGLIKYDLEYLTDPSFTKVCIILYRTVKIIVLGKEKYFSGQEC